MELWILLAFAAQFLYAVSILIDKHIVIRARAIGEPAAYAFFSVLFSAVVAGFAPFGFVSWPTWSLIGIALMNGMAFFTALFTLYSALKIARASDVAPAVGGISALTTIVLSALILHTDVEGFILPAFLLAIGTAIISHFHFSRSALLYTICAGVAFGSTVFLSKLVFERTDFIDAFFWMRMMGVLFVLSLLLLPQMRAKIFHSAKQSTRGAWALVMGNKVIAGAASILFSFAVSLGSVALVNALTGLQFVFLFIMSILFARYMPGMKQDSLTHGGWHTGVGIGLICVGLAALAYTFA